jgi:hypothetical protein
MPLPFSKGQKMMTTFAKGTTTTTIIPPTSLGLKRSGSEVLVFSCNNKRDCIQIEQT